MRILKKMNICRDTCIEIKIGAGVGSEIRGNHSASQKKKKKKGK